MAMRRSAVWGESVGSDAVFVKVDAECAKVTRAGVGHHDRHGDDVRVRDARHIPAIS
jgi:hypothetical protein